MISSVADIYSLIAYLPLGKYQGNTLIDMTLVKTLKPTVSMHAFVMFNGLFFCHICSLK